MDNFDLVQIIDASHSAAPDVGLVVLAIFTFMAVVFSLLVLRQAGQMVHVLPTPVSPLVRVLALGYSVFTIGTFILIMSFIF